MSALFLQVLRQEIGLKVSARRYYPSCGRQNKRGSVYAKWGNPWVAAETKEDRKRRRKEEGGPEHDGIGANYFVS
ncbi:MAG: hypothetical protein M3M86_03455 [Thermoproteota archaeon]|nr:hypothetical protein [Thermoproteota archaeon]